MKHILLVFVALLSVSSISAQQLWKKIEKDTGLQQKQELYVNDKLPKSFQLFSFESELFLNLASKSKASKKQIIQLPDESGLFSEFYLQKTQNFQSKLAKKFPSIQSFRVVKVSDRTVTGRISVGTNGFNAVISSPHKKPIIIAPYTKDKSKYMVYNKASLDNEKEHFECNVIGVNDLAHKANESKKNNDGFLRTYRIAIVASAEYSQFHLNREGISSAASDQIKKATVLSAINRSLTRINEIFERELSVNFSLVADNDKIIFFDTTTDGITIDDIVIMIEESQSICDRDIGNNNYDIGHVLGVDIGFNGLAAAGTVCLFGQKARAATLNSFPVGDTFDVDLFAHEIGHQFGAFHTYNNSCERNRENLTAIEPGSGSTIMSYAGICPPNVQGRVDDYFHTVSLTQMWNVIQASGTCALLTNTNNTAPTVNAGLDYVIPAGTPFVLSGTALDSENSATLTYAWEQTDNEIASMPPLASSSKGPAFRSLPPKNVPERYFPDLEDVIAGTSPTWEVLPTVARSLDFTLTVRGNNSSGGSFATDEINVTVVDAAPFIITSQNTTEVWDVGSTQTITWNVGATNQSPINTQFVTIKLSTDGGKTFPISLVESTVNDGEESFVVPENVSENVRVMVMANDNIYFDVNDSTIQIRSTIPTFIFTVDNEVAFACNSGNESVTYNLNLDFVNDFSEEVSFSVEGLPDGTVINFSPESINEDGNVLVTISNLDGISAQNYPITFTATSASVTRNIVANLSITNTVNSSVGLVLPANGSDEVPVAAGLSWQENSDASSYLIEIATDVNFETVVTEASSEINAFTALNLVKGTVYYWRVKPINTCSEGVFSEVFSFTTEVCEVCQSEGNDELDTSTTFVGFNTIANATPNKTSGYMDFTEISTTVARDSTYLLTVNANTDGNFTTRTIVWIDWNQNCDFEENEEYDLGTATSTSNGQTSLSPLEIQVPSNSVLGSVIMRVTTKFENDGPQTPCEIGADAEVEDYTIIVDEVADTQEFDFDNFEMYPNPASDSFTIKLFLENQSDLQVQILDLRGRVVEAQKYDNVGSVFLGTIKFDKKTSGMYFVRLINGDNVLVKRLVIR